MINCASKEYNCQYIFPCGNLQYTDGATFRNY